MKCCLVPLIAISALTWAQVADARVNPLRVITERLVRSEIVIVLDTSGSMAWYPNPSWSVGTDCGGDRRNTVDLCGDGMCTGSEGSSGNRCSADCPIAKHDEFKPGSPPSCHPYQSSSSRMFMVKRVLRNLLPGLRGSASLGLITFKQRGYYQYYPADTRGATKKVSVFFSKMEMERLNAWDATYKRPMESFLWNGTRYTLLSKAGMTVDRDSLYSRIDDLSTEDRYRFSSAGLVHTNNAVTWRYKGSYYTYTQRKVNKFRAKEMESYMGPQFTDAQGKVWIYHRYDYNYTSQGIDAAEAGMVMEPLSSERSQAAHDKALASILAHMNTARNGGLWAWGGTPTGTAIHEAEKHFASRQRGNNSFQGAADPAAACRPRYVLLLTDGQSNRGLKPYYSAQRMYERKEFAGNPVKTIVVGLPGLPASAVTELDRTADMGDDGTENSSRTAYFANDEEALVRVIKEALLEMVQGDYTTTASGLATSYDAQVAGNLALIPSTNFPGWQGHLRAKDLSSTLTPNRWDAGKELKNRTYNTRRIYTGFPSSNNGAPVPLFSLSGKVNLSGGCSGCGPAGVLDVWRRMATPPSSDEVTALVQWLAGKGRTWKLGPIFRSVPATVGPPPPRDLPGHNAFARKHASRDKLAYVTSNDGMLHAFRVADGKEAFAYIPPNLWPKIHDLWKQGGQDTDPKEFKWILASSPRTMDIPPKVAGTADWTTQLMLTMGPGDDAFVVLDITAPSNCNAFGCSVKSEPIKILRHSRDMSLGQVMGETWSVPTYFYARTRSGQIKAQMAMGGGYASGQPGNYYMFFPSLYKAPSHNLHQPRSGGDVALLASPASVVDKDKDMTIVATYQADLSGDILRYRAGDSAKGVKVLSAGVDSPFYYSPAVRLRKDGTVMMAAASGSLLEETPLTTAESRIYLRTESNGEVSLTKDSISCNISAICGRGKGCPGKVPTDCKAPSSRALPVGSPMILKNQIDDAYQHEAFYLYYDPPASVCSLGSTWLVRVATTGANQEVISSVKFDSTRASGMTLVGGGRDLAITTVGLGKEEASMFSVFGLIQAGPGGPALVETRTEVPKYRDVRASSEITVNAR